MKRTDIHRLGAIEPHRYSLVLDYSMSTTEDGEPVPSFGINCEIDGMSHAGDLGRHAADGRCCVVGLRNIAKVKFAQHGGTGQCTVCGARFVHGSVWVHENGDHIHVGHQCAEKYEMLASHEGFDARYEAFKRAHAARRVGERRAALRAETLANNPGLREALEVQHDTIQDIRRRFECFGELSEPTIALVFKIARELAARAAEKHVPAPEGKATVKGRIVSAKWDEGFYRTALKMTVKVETPDGSWLAWGTCPDAIVQEAAKRNPGDAAAILRGSEIEFSATLARGRDPHFALFKWPTKAAATFRTMPTQDAAA